MFFNGAIILLAIAGHSKCLTEEEAMIIDLIVYNNTELPRQFAFLYLHDTEGKIYFESTEESHILNDVLPPDSVKLFTSILSSTNNFLLAIPDKFISTLHHRGQHAEFKLLSDLQRNIDWYPSRNKWHCPEHIILGSVYLPCLETSDNIKIKKNRAKHECARKYVEMKNQLKSECPETEFYLYVRCPMRTHPEVYREEIINLIQREGIRILFPPHPRTSPDSDFYKKYCSKRQGTAET